MTRTARLAYFAFLLAVVAVTAPFATPDMPWWSGLAIIMALLAVYGVVRLAEDLERFAALCRHWASLADLSRDSPQ